MAASRSTAIYYLLARGERSHWHRIDAVETWHYYAGSPLTLRSPMTAPPQRSRLGTDLAERRATPGIVPAMPGRWRKPPASGRWSAAPSHPPSSSRSSSSRRRAGSLSASVLIESELKLWILSFDAFSSREPVSTSLENALIARSGIGWVRSVAHRRTALTKNEERTMHGTLDPAAIQIEPAILLFRNAGRADRIDQRRRLAQSRADVVGLVGGLALHARARAQFEDHREHDSHRRMRAQSAVGRSGRRGRSPRAHHGLGSGARRQDQARLSA